MCRFSLLYAAGLLISLPCSFPLTLPTLSSASKNSLAVSSCNTLFLFLAGFYTLPRLSFPLLLSLNPFRDRSVSVAEVAAEDFRLKTVTFR